MRHVLSIPDWHPTRVNRLLSTHPKGRSKLKRADAKMVGIYAMVQGVPKAAGKRRVGLTFVYGRTGTMADPDAFLKCCLDALVESGLLVDDSGEFCELEKPLVIRGDEKRTEIVLEDVE